MRLPQQSPPVKRPDLIQPYAAVDIIHGSIEDMVHIRMDLLHGANYNDPAAYAHRTYGQLKNSGHCSCTQV